MEFNFLFYPVIFLFGLVAGSFLNCVIYRLEVSKSFLKGRSFCPHCKHQLNWQDLIPLLSFLILRGKCRYCQKPISFQYPFVELITGILFLCVGQVGGESFSILFNWMITCLLIIIFVYDLRHYIIPDRVIYSAIGVAFLYRVFEALAINHWPLGFEISSLAIPLLSAFGAATFFLTIVLISQGRWMGVGDIKLAFLMGLILGWPNILAALFLAFFIGAIFGIALIIAGRKTLKSEVPFGPFLVVGTFIALFWGQEVINWYLNFFLLK